MCPKHNKYQLQLPSLCGLRKICILRNELNQLSFHITNQHVSLRLNCEKPTASWNLPLTHCCTLRFKVMSPHMILWICGDPKPSWECYNYDTVNHHSPANAMRQKAFNDSFSSRVPAPPKNLMVWLGMAWSQPRLALKSCQSSFGIIYRYLSQGHTSLVFSFLFHSGLWDRPTPA